MNVYRGAAEDLSDHYLVETKFRMKGFHERKSCEKEVGEAFVILIVNEWDRIRNARVLSVEDEWGMFKSIVMICAARVCGYKV